MGAASSKKIVEDAVLDDWAVLQAGLSSRLDAFSVGTKVLRESHDPSQLQQHVEAGWELVTQARAVVDAICRRPDLAVSLTVETQVGPVTE